MLSAQPGAASYLRMRVHHTELAVAAELLVVPAAERQEDPTNLPAGRSLRQRVIATLLKCQDTHYLAPTNNVITLVAVG